LTSLRLATDFWATCAWLLCDLRLASLQLAIDLIPSCSTVHRAYWICTSCHYQWTNLQKTRGSLAMVTFLSKHAPWYTAGFKKKF